MEEEQEYIAPFWAELGLEKPTGDLIEIKRAYARQLKTKRPDDDAQAYQNLRQAYEWAQGYARWYQMTQQEDGQQEQGEHPQESAPMVQEPLQAEQLAQPLPAETPVASKPLESAPPAAASEEAKTFPTDDGLGQAHAQTASTLPTEEDYPELLPDVHALVAEMEADCQQGGARLLMQRKSDYLARIYEIPFQQMGLASVLYADLVLRQPQMPDELTGALAQQFSWGTDYRSEILLGIDRAEALRQRLEQAVPSPITDPQVLMQHDNLLRMRKHIDGKRWSWKAFLLALLMEPAQVMRYESLSGTTMRRMGLETFQFSSIESMVFMARLLLYFLGTLGLLTFFPNPTIYKLASNTNSSIGHAAVIIFGGAFLSTVAMMAASAIEGASVSFCQTWRAWSSSWIPKRWRERYEGALSGMSDRFIFSQAIVAIVLIVALVLIYKGQPSTDPQLWVYPALLVGLCLLWLPFWLPSLTWVAAVMPALIVCTTLTWVGQFKLELWSAGFACACILGFLARAWMGRQPQVCTLIGQGVSFMLQVGMRGRELSAQASVLWGMGLLFAAMLAFSPVALPFVMIAMAMAHGSRFVVACIFVGLYLWMSPAFAWSWGLGMNLLGVLLLAVEVVRLMRSISNAAWVRKLL